MSGIAASDVVPTRGGPARAHALRPLAGLVVQLVLVVLVARAGLRFVGTLPDFRCYWTAGVLMARVQSPYDPQGQTEVQEHYGWNKTTDGEGLYDFQPYYYPPWLGLVCVPLVPLGFGNAQLVWLALNVELVLLAGCWLSALVPGLPRRLPVVATFTFAFTLLALLMGQTSPLVFFLTVLAWRLMDRRQDFAAGCALAALAFKPQLAAPLLLGVAIWSGSQRRWRVLAGGAAGLTVLSLASALLVPDWPLQMLRATRDAPLPTDLFPWIGTTWLLVLKTVGLHSWSLGLGYLAVAVPAAGAVLRLALSRSGTLAELFAVGLLATFFIAPYSQPYDYPILLVPLLVLMGTRLRERAGLALFALVLAGSYLHLIYLGRMHLWWIAATRPAPKVTLFWVPLVLALVWIVSGLPQRRRVEQPRAASCQLEAVASG